MLRPSTALGRPALGMALIGLVVKRIIRSMVSSVTLGPTEQLRPMTSTGHSSSSRVKVSVSVPSRQIAEIVDGDLGDDGDGVAGDLARGADGFAQFVEVAEGLEDQQVDAGFDQRFDLLAESRRALRRRRWDRAARCARRAVRWRRPRRRLRRPLRGPAERRPRLMARSFSAMPKAARRTRLAPKVLVSRISAPALTYSWWICADQVRSGEIQLVEAAVDEDAAGVEHGAHGAVGHHDAVLQLAAEEGGL